MHISMRMRVHMICISHQDDITLPTLAFHNVLSSLFHTEVYDITWLNGAVQVSGEFMAIFSSYTNAKIAKRPQNKHELFNLRHASLQNAIERIFGVLKRQFQILLLAPEYDLEIQAKIPAALCAIHNFIKEHDLDEGDLEETRDFFDECRRDENEPFALGDPEETGSMQDQIAEEMWLEYQHILAEQGMQPGDEESDSESSHSGNNSDF